MISSRRVPTGLLVLFAVIVVGAGALWWTRAAPADRPAAKAASGDGVMIMQLQNGAVLADGGTRSPAFGGSSHQQDSIERLISAQWPCRINPPGHRPFDLMHDSLNIVSLQGIRVVRLPTCGGTPAPRR
jgi:hypothetical protein